MSNYDDTNRGSLWRNKRREKDTQPTHTGSINIEGREYWLDAWVNECGPNTKTPGEKFFSVKVKPKDSGPQPDPRAPMNQAPEDSDIPF